MHKILLHNFLRPARPSLYFGLRSSFPVGLRARPRRRHRWLSDTRKDNNSEPSSIVALVLGSRSSHPDSSVNSLFERLCPVERMLQLSIGNDEIAVLYVPRQISIFSYVVIDCASFLPSAQKEIFSGFQPSTPTSPPDHPNSRTKSLRAKEQKKKMNEIRSFLFRRRESNPGLAGTR